MSEPAAPPPKISAERLALRTRPPVVARMSRRAIAAATGVVGLTILGAAIWSLQGTERGSGSSKPELYNVDRISRAEGLERLPPDYGVMAKTPEGVPQLGPPLPGDLGRPILNAQQDGRLDPAAAPMPSAADAAADARRAQLEQARREREAIRRSDVFFGSASPAANAASVASPLPDGDRAAGPDGIAAPADGTQAAKRAFLSAEPEKRIYASGTLHKPISPYQLMAGSVIPAALITGISSDLPGQAMASVTANVYDSVTGRHLLIPQGARLIGRYDSAVGYGQSRLLLIWERLIMPNGNSILLDNLPGTDASGRAGLRDKVDSHLDRLIGGAALATLLGVGAELAAPRQSGTDGQIIIATRDGAQEAISEIGQQITRRNLDVQPTLTIRPGYPLRVLVQRDLVLEKIPSG